MPVGGTWNDFAGRWCGHLSSTREFYQVGDFAGGVDLGSQWRKKITSDTGSFAQVST